MVANNIPIIHHDYIAGYIAAEHIDWALTGAQDIHIDRITQAAVTQHNGALDHDTLSGVDASEHIDWSVTGVETVHGDRIAAGAVTQHEGAINHDALLNYVANDHIDWTGASVALLTSGSITTTNEFVCNNDNTGITFGATNKARIWYNEADLIIEPSYVGTGGVKIKSTDESDYLKFYHDNTNAYFTTDDGAFTFITDEGTNTDAYVNIQGKGTGVGTLRIFSQDDAGYGEIVSYNNDLFLRTNSGQPGDVKIQSKADGDVTLFEDTQVGDAAVGKSLYIYRKAAEGDNYIKLYSSASGSPYLHLESLTANSYIDANNKLNFNQWGQDNVAFFSSALEAKTPVLSISGYPSGGSIDTVAMGFNATWQGQFDFTGANNAYTFDNDVEVYGAFDVSGILSVTDTINASTGEDMVFEVQGDPVLRMITKWSTAWVDDTPSDFFQFGAAYAIFSSWVGAPLERIAFATHSMKITNEGAGDIIAPLAMLHVKENAADTEVARFEAYGGETVIIDKDCNVAVDGELTVLGVFDFTDSASTNAMALWNNTGAHTRLAIHGSGVNSAVLDFYQGVLPTEATNWNRFRIVNGSTGVSMTYATGGSDSSDKSITIATKNFIDQLVLQTDGSVDVNGEFTVDADAYITGDLHVTVDIYITGDLNVENATSLMATDVDGLLKVIGDDSGHNLQMWSATQSYIRSFGGALNINSDNSQDVIFFADAEDESRQLVIYGDTTGGPVDSCRVGFSGGDPGTFEFLGADNLYYFDNDVEIQGDLEVQSLSQLGSILKLQPTASGNVVLFSDNDVADANDGRKLIIHRKAAEADTYLELYVSDEGNPTIGTFTAFNPLYLMPEANASVVLFGDKSEGDTKSLIIHGHPTGGAAGAALLGFDSTVDGRFKISGADTDYYFDNDVTVDGSIQCGSLARFKSGDGSSGMSIAIASNVEATLTFKDGILTAYTGK